MERIVIEIRIVLKIKQPTPSYSAFASQSASIFFSLLENSNFCSLRKQQKNFSRRSKKLDAIFTSWKVDHFPVIHSLSPNIYFL